MWKIESEDSQVLLGRVAKGSLMYP